MIYLRLSGGLGNQLYQSAAASLLSQTTSMPVVPLLDGLSRYEERRAPDFLALLQQTSWLLSPTSPVPRLWRSLSLKARAGRWLPVVGISDRNFWQVIGRSARSDLILDGYFQQGWKADSLSRAIAQMPARPILNVASERIGMDEVVIHIRGGDFLRLPRYQVVDAHFYIRAACQAMESGLTRFAIITDDPPYATSICDQICNQLTGAGVRLIPSGANAIEDFDTLRAARARIIGNSTFAWWAAALGDPYAPTWSPTMFTTDVTRDFFLSNERPIFCAI